MGPLDLVWLFFILSSLQPMLQQRNGSRAITMIHRREGFAFLGIPFGGFIDIDDSEAVIRAIEMTDDELPIDMVLHTPGGLVLAAEQIAAALAAHPGRVTVHVPHYAMRGGTLIALAADRISMSPSAVLGPIDPQIGQMAAASILAAVARKDVNEVDDQTLILADVSAKAQRQVIDFATGLLARHLPQDRAREVATTLGEGRWTHDFPIDVGLARSLGLPVDDDLDPTVRELMGLYPQPRNQRPSVEYIPLPYDRRGPGGTRDQRPRSTR